MSEYGYSGYGIIKPLPSTTQTDHLGRPITYWGGLAKTPERKTMERPHTEAFVRDLLGKLHVASDSVSGGFLDLLMQLLPMLLSLLEDCPASRIKRAAQGRWVPGKALKMFQVRLGIRNELGEETDDAFGGFLFGAIIELAAESSVERLSGVLQEAQI